MCLYLPGRSGKKKPEEEASTGRPQAETSPAPDQQPTTDAEQAPSRAASLEKFECASVHSGNNIVFDFVMDEAGEAAAGATPVHGYCPSPCFDLPVELIRAGERYSAVCDTPVTAAFMFGDYQGAALKKMASCLASGVEAREAPHLVRFLSASSPSMPRNPATPSRPSPTVAGDYCELGDGACAQRHHPGFPEQEAAV